MTKKDAIDQHRQHPYQHPHPERRPADRPLHLGHYFGSLANRVGLQAAGGELFLVIADYQVITDRDTPGSVRDRTVGLVLDYLGCGIDPDRSVIFAHSAVPELHQLMLPFLSLVSTGELDRNPDGEGRDPAGRTAFGKRADAHLSGPPGGGHPVLQSGSGAGRP